MAEKEKKNIFQRWGTSIRGYWRETIGELRKVAWPTPKDTWGLTKIVLLVLLVMSAILGFWDFILSQIVKALLA